MSVVHLVDDTGAGGVTRFLQFLSGAPGLPRQEIVAVRRGRWSAPKMSADVIVSHLVLSWRTLPMLTALRARYPSTPIIHVEHHYTRSFAAARVHNKARFEAMLGAAFSLFDRVVAVSEAQARWLTDADLICPPTLSVIPPAVDLSAFAEIENKAGPARRVAALGRLDDAKGFDVLISTIAQGSDFELHIHGDGPERAALMQIARGLPVVFHGHSDPVEAFDAADVIAMPSRYEAYGLVALEARAAGRPVLVSGVDGLSDHVGEGAISIGSNVKDWAAAFRDIDRFVSTARVAVARQRALASPERCIQRWRDLLWSHAMDQHKPVAA